jgi:hypothetical protein
LPSTTLDFKQTLHQLREVFHDFLQGWQDWLVDMLGDSQTGNWSKLDTLGVKVLRRPHLAFSHGACSSSY